MLDFISSKIILFCVPAHVCACKLAPAYVDICWAHSFYIYVTNNTLCVQWAYISVRKLNFRCCNPGRSAQFHLLWLLWQKRRARTTHTHTHYAFDSIAVIQTRNVNSFCKSVLKYLMEHKCMNCECGLCFCIITIFPADWHEAVRTGVLSPWYVYSTWLGTEQAPMHHYLENKIIFQMTRMIRRFSTFNTGYYFLIRDLGKLFCIIYIWLICVCTHLKLASVCDPAG